jgi:hypothetical protein
LAAAIRILKFGFEVLDGKNIQQAITTLRRELKLL